MNGTIRPHGKTAGYIILGLPDERPKCVCHGLEDPSKNWLAHGEPATLFATRKEARKVIRKHEKNDRTFRIIRLAPLAEKP